MSRDRSGWAGTPATAAADGAPAAHVWDAVVVGSGFGGAMAAYALVASGHHVLVLERGDWLESGPQQSGWSVRWTKRPGYCEETPYVLEGERRGELGSFHCVGGMSAFYGGVALRMRERDFGGYPTVSGDVRWPIAYDDLLPHYENAERLLGVVGDERPDATAPRRERPLPPPADGLSDSSRVIAAAATRLGLRAFRLPTTLRGHPNGAGRAPCTACDGFACGGKADLGASLLRRLVERGLAIRTGAVVRGLEVDAERIVAAHAMDTRSGERLRIRARHFVLAAGALGTPHVLLASQLHTRCSAGHAVGRHLMRHCNGIVLAGGPPSVEDTRDARKQLGVHDFYFGDPDRGFDDRLGAIQQLRATRIALSVLPLPSAARRALHGPLSRVLGLLVMVEDQPRPENRVYLDAARRDRYGRPLARVHHRHSERDRRARRALAARACEILREAHAAFCVTVPVRTFSHALGTVRMGDDSARYPVTPDGRFRGVDNLWITDASVFPTAAAVNPSLTIAANALRIASGIERTSPARGATRRRQLRSSGSTRVGTS